jgi:uncharacterized protein YegL
MNENLTELVLILDKSGSMSGLEKDTIGGYNSMLEKQKSQEGSAHVTTVLFNHQVEILHDRLPLGCVEPITSKEYTVGGMTALLDAVGTTINRIDQIQQAEPEENRAGKVIFVITTDGFENSSREFTYPVLKNLIEKQQKEKDWEFIFLGANMDAVAEAGKIGIHADRSATFMNDSEGIANNYESLSDAVSFMRYAPKGERLGASWKSRIDEDYKKRSGRK